MVLKSAARLSESSTPENDSQVASSFFVVVAITGALSPPLNLSIELLDFKALVRWLPGPGNPKGTRYSVEFIDIGHL